MTETFPFDDAHVCADWEARRACTARSLTTVAHLNITPPRVTHSVTRRNKQEAFSENDVAGS